MLLQYCFAIVVLISSQAAEGGSVSIFEELRLESNAELSAMGWVCSKISCYYTSGETATFEEALAKCRKIYANLVEVNDEAEFQFLKSQAEHNNLPNDFWIGLTDSFEEGKYIWMNTFKEASYTRWHPSQPDDAGHSEDCVHMYSGNSYTWNDVTCGVRLKFVCEK